MQSGEQKMGDFFAGFNSFGQIVLYVLVLFLMIIPAFVVVFVAVIPYEEIFALMSNSSDSDAVAALTSALLDNLGMIIILFLALIAYVLYLSVSYVFVLPLIVDAKLGFWQAME